MNVFREFAFEDIMRIALAMVIIIASLLSIGYVIWGGFLMIVSGGDEEKIKKAVNHIRHAIIGILFLLLILFVFPTLMDLIGLPYGEYAKPSAIFQTIGEISDTIFGTAGSSLIDGIPSSDLPSNFSDI